MKKADELLSGIDALDVLVLPEMIFTGIKRLSKAIHLRTKSISYHFWKTKMGQPSNGRSRLVHNFDLAKRFNSLVQVGFPLAEGAIYYNAVCLVKPTGLWKIYRKHFLFETDESWATAGNSFESFNDDSLGKIGVGICMDLNPKAFLSPFELFEWANFQQISKVNIILCSMAWLYQEAPSMETIQYWATRMTPLIKSSGSNPIYVLVANRNGREGFTFCGSSAIMVFENSSARLLSSFGKDDQGVLIVDTLKS